MRRHYFPICVKHDHATGGVIGYAVTNSNGMSVYFHGGHEKTIAQIYTIFGDISFIVENKIIVEKDGIFPVTELIRSFIITHWSFDARKE